MARDEFERLERRWRERPLFSERPKRKPVWILVGLAASVVLLLGIAAVAPPNADQLLDDFVNVRAEPPQSQDAETTQSRLGIPLFSDRR